MAEHPRIDDLRRRVEKDPASIAFAQLAEEHRRAGDFEEAVRVCRNGLERHPAYLSARVTLGRALVELERFDEAETEFKYVLGAAPDNLVAVKAIDDIRARRPTDYLAPTPPEPQPEPEPETPPPAAEPTASWHDEEPDAPSAPLEVSMTENPSEARSSVPEYVDSETISNEQMLARVPGAVIPMMDVSDSSPASPSSVLDPLLEELEAWLAAVTRHRAPHGTAAQLPDESTHRWR